MIRLYEGNGAKDFSLVATCDQQEWNRKRRSMCRLLNARNAGSAANYLDTIPFELWEGTNPFKDAFHVLQVTVPLDSYVEIAERCENLEAKSDFKQIAETISEVGPYIRFIIVNLDTSSELDFVPIPVLSITSDTVERALADSERLVQTGGAVSGVDRIHTVFHGYLKEVCADSKISIPEDASLTQVFKAIRTSHPNFKDKGTRGSDIDRIAQSMSTILDALNPIRNQASLAHPNDVVLEEAEATLVINSVRTLLNYVDSKIKRREV